MCYLRTDISVFVVYLSIDFLMIKAYIKRNTILRSLGFDSYTQYLASSVWQNIRTRHLAKYPDCYGCGKTATQVHHGKYTRANLSGVSSRWLYSACSGCHFKSAFTDYGNKRGPQKATTTLKKLRNKAYWSPSEFGRYVLYGNDKINSLDNELKQILNS